MTNALTHQKGIVIIASLLFISLCCAALYLYQPLLAFAGFAIVALAGLVTRTEWLFYVLVGTIPWSIEYITPSLTTDLPDEPLMLLTGFSIVLYLIAKRKSMGQLELRSTLLFLILLQLLWSALAALASTDQFVSIKFLLAKCWYLVALVLVPVILFRNRRVMINSAKVLTASMLVLMIIVQFRHAAEGFTFSGINPSLEPFFRNHVNYSALLVCIVPLLLAFHSAAEKPAIKRGLKLLIVITVAALYFSYARGAWLALFAGLAGWWLLKKRALLAAYVIGLLIVFSSLAWLIHKNNYLRFSHDYQTTIFHEDFREHLVATYQFKDVSTAERFYRWIAGVRMVKHNWETGFGPNTFPDQYKYYAVPAFKTWVSANEDRSTVHNYFLTMAIEQGIPGLLLLLVMLGYAFHIAQKIYHRAKDACTRITARTCAMLLCMLVTVNFLSDLVETDKVGSIFYITLATLIVLERQSLRSSLSHSTHPLIHYQKD